MDNDVISETTSIERWVSDYADDLYSWAFYKTSNKEVAEDLTQDTFLAAAKGASKFKGDSNPKTWLFSILNNKIADYHKKKFKKMNAGIMEDGDQSSFFNEKGEWRENNLPSIWENYDEHLLDNSMFNDALKQCLHALPELWFSATTMKYHSQKKGSEICQELGISESNYWQILHRSKLQLRSCLNTNWFTKENK
ncbi:MAG: sigma-70 family RNA polymerase sigma factor [Crocinitomicaceae bacterium]|nr:sigma-70 family RNA polymerase sigma factor [Crocinitomicaceae bacterium]